MIGRARAAARTAPTHSLRGRVALERGPASRQAARSWLALGDRDDAVADVDAAVRVFGVDDDHGVAAAVTHTQRWGVRSRLEQACSLARELADVNRVAGGRAVHRRIERH